MSTAGYGRKIHSICLIKNEEDIIEYCLREASSWSDFIYVYDNGSTDATWQKVLDMESDRIIPWKQDDKPFKEALRGEVFNHFQHRANPGDWWCRLDADEFYARSPKEFLATVPAHHHVVWGIAVEYYLTQKDIQHIDFNQPIQNVLSNIRYYKVENSEARFFKHRKGLDWGENDAWPKHVGIVTPERIAYRHYKYRTPQQIQLRLDTRQQARDKGFPGWEHAQAAHWKEKVTEAKTLSYDAKDGNLSIDSSKLPQHMESSDRRLLKRVLHATGVWP